MRKLLNLLFRKLAFQYHLLNNHTSQFKMSNLIYAKYLVQSILLVINFNQVPQ